MALTSAAQTGSGQQGYFVTRSTQFNAYNAWAAFDNDNPLDASAAASAGWASAGPSSQPDTYSSSTGAATAQAATHPDNLTQGEWIQIQLPDSIYLHDIKIHSRAETNYTDNTTGFPKNVYLYGKNSSQWILIKEFTTSSKTLGDAYTEYINYTKDAFTHFVLVVKTIHVSGTTLNHPGWTSIGQIELFGVPEYDPDAHGTDVTVKSVANVPNTDWLEVYYDGQDYPNMPSTVDNKTGVSTYDATPSGGVGFDSTYKAFTFDSSFNQYLSTSTPMSGNYIHSFSMWFKPTNLTATSGDELLYVGANGTSTKVEVFIESDRINYTFGANDYQAYRPFLNNVWHHLVLTYNGVGGQSGREIYLDGVRQEATHTGSTGVLAISTNNLDIGRYTPSGSSTAYAFDGSIANFRLFNRALTSDEIYQLYAYQKEDFGHGDLSMTLKAGRLGIGTSEPRAALDVRGMLKISDTIDSPFFKVFSIFDKADPTVDHSHWSSSVEGIIRANSTVIVTVNVGGYRSTAGNGTFNIQYRKAGTTGFLGLSDIFLYFNHINTHVYRNRTFVWKPTVDIHFVEWKITFDHNCNGDDKADLVLVSLPV